MDNTFRSEDMKGKRVRRYIEKSDVFEYGTLERVIATTGELIISKPDTKMTFLWQIDECEILEN